MRKTKGFTLIELLVVIAIIGLLSSVVLASLDTAREKAADTRAIQTLHQLSTALELYYQDHNRSYPIPTRDARGYYIDYNGYRTGSLDPSFKEIVNKKYISSIYVSGKNKSTPDMGGESPISYILRHNEVPSINPLATQDYYCNNGSTDPDYVLIVPTFKTLGDNDSYLLAQTSTGPVLHAKNYYCVSQ